MWRTVTSDSGEPIQDFPDVVSFIVEKEEEAVPDMKKANRAIFDRVQNNERTVNVWKERH